MAVRIDALGDYLRRTTNLPSSTAITISGWTRIVTDQGSGVYQPICVPLNSATFDAYGLYWDQAASAGSMRLFSAIAGVESSAVNFSSRPAVGEDFFWYIKCSGTGAGLLEAGYRKVGENSFTTVTATQAAVTGINDVSIANVISTYYGDSRHTNVKMWDRALSSAELMIESFYERPQFPTSLNLWWPLPNAGDTADRSGNGRNPTVGGTLTTEDTGFRLWRPSTKVYIPAAGGNVTLALTGVSATGAVGNLGDAVSYAITGNAATGSVGTVVPAVSYALTGLSATGNVGAVVANVSYALTGASATGQVGTLSTGNDVTLALTGVAATGGVGSLVSSLSYTLTGNAAAGAVGSAVSSIAYALTGLQATGAVGSVGDAVSYGLTGVQATGQAGTLSVAGDVTIALTGVQATGQVGTLSIQGAAESTGAGSNKTRRRQRYIARFKGEDHEFSTLEALEEFVQQAQKVEEKRPQKARQPIRIELAPAFFEELPPTIPRPQQLQPIRPSKALEQIKKLERRIDRAIQDEEEENEVLLWLM